MIITNETNLPASVYAAVAYDGYSRGHSDISVTDLIAPPRMVALREQYGDTLTEDVADMAARFIGTCVHNELERYKTTDLSESRFFISVKGWSVGGKPDNFEPIGTQLFFVNGKDVITPVFTKNGIVPVKTVGDGTLTDYKTIKATEFMYGLKEERTQQLNIYAEMLRLNGYEVKKLTAVLFIVDFSWPAVERDRRYPPRSIVEVPLEMWPRERVQQFIHDRVRLHQAARVSLPNCTDEERWKRDDYAIKRTGTDRAIKLFRDAHPIEAEEWGIEQGIAELSANGVTWAEGYSVEHRPGKALRCQWYCSAAQVCSQRQGELNDRG